MHGQSATVTCYTRCNMLFWGRALGTFGYHKGLPKWKKAEYQKSQVGIS